MLHPDEMRNALLADRVETVAGWLDAGADVNMRLDGRGATPLFFACTPAMVTVLLDHNADATVVLSDGTSVLDASAHEGQVEIARRLLRAAPKIATEQRALLAA